MNRLPKALLEYALLVWIVFPIAFIFCLMAIASDLHSMRIEFTTANAEWRRETFRRLDQFAWKADTALELASAARLDLGNMLTKIRAQVKQSSDASAAVAKTQTQAATVAVTKALDTTREAIQAVVPPAERAEPEKPITVNVPAPVVTVPAPRPETPHVEVTPVKPKRRRWYTYLWHWW